MSVRLRASYGLMRLSKERRSLKSPMSFLRDLGIWANALLPPRPARPKSGLAAFKHRAFTVRASRLLCSRRSRPEAFAAARRVD
jgi:hypothetical protein